MPGISILVYDSDSWGKKDLIGRAWMDLERGYPEQEGGNLINLNGSRDSKISYVQRKVATWQPLEFEATGEKEGSVLVGYRLHPLDKPIPPMENIRPKTVEGLLSNVCIGLRDVISSLNMIPTKRAQLFFDVSGDT